MSYDDDDIRALEVRVGDLEDLLRDSLEVQHKLAVQTLRLAQQVESHLNEKPRGLTPPDCAACTGRDTGYFCSAHSWHQS
jgi:hypothetical protein